MFLYFIKFIITSTYKHRRNLGTVGNCPQTFYKEGASILFSLPVLSYISLWVHNLILIVKFKFELFLKKNI